MSWWGRACHTEHKCIFDQHQSLLDQTQCIHYSADAAIVPQRLPNSTRFGYGFVARLYTYSTLAWPVGDVWILASSIHTGSACKVTIQGSQRMIIRQDLIHSVVFPPRQTMKTLKPHECSRVSQQHVLRVSQLRGGHFPTRTTYQTWGAGIVGYHQMAQFRHHDISSLSFQFN